MQDQLGEGHGTNRPPLFNGTYYRYWKTRMQVVLESQSFDVWSLIEEGYHPPTVIEQDCLGKPISIKTKPRKDWTQEECQG